MNTKMDIEHWCKNSDRRKPMYWRKSLPYWHFIHHKSHLDWSGTEVLPGWQDCGCNCMNLWRPKWMTLNTFSSYRTEKTECFHRKNQSVNMGVQTFH